MSAGYDNIVAFDERFTPPSHVSDSELTGYQRGFKNHQLPYGGDHPFSVEVAFNAILAVAFLLASLFMVVITYVDLVCKNFEANTTKRAELLFDSWWKYNRILILIEVSFTVAGCAYSAGSASLQVYICFPDYFYETYGKAKRSLFSPYGLSRFMLADMQNVFFGIALIILSISTIRYYYTKLPIKRQEADEQNTELVKLNEQRWQRFFQSPAINDYFRDYQEEYIEIFIDNRFDIDDRAGITDHQLESMGIKLIGHRVKLLTHFVQYQEDEKALLKNEDSVEKINNSSAASSNRIHPM